MKHKQHHYSVAPNR